MRSEAKSVDAYLAALPAERRAVVETVLTVIRENMPPGYEEVMAWGMPTWQVPLSVAPDTYNGQPLVYASLAAQKSHYAIYLMTIVGERAVAFEAAYRATGKKYDVGKSCVRFKALDQLPLELVGKTIAAVGVPEFVGMTKK